MVQRLANRSMKQKREHRNRPQYVYTSDKWPRFGERTNFSINGTGSIKYSCGKKWNVKYYPVGQSQCRSLGFWSRVILSITGIIQLLKSWKSLHNVLSYKWYILFYSWQLKCDASCYHSFKVKHPSPNKLLENVGQRWFIMWPICNLRAYMRES